MSQKVMNYTPATNEDYASMVVYSTETGEFQHHYLKDDKWIRINLPQVPFTVPKGDLVMNYTPETSVDFPNMFIYSKTTGEFEQWYFQDGKWKQNNKLPQLPFTITKGKLVMKYTYETYSYPAQMFVYDEIIGENQHFYVDKGSWKKIAIPELKIDFE